MICHERSVSQTPSWSILVDVLSPECNYSDNHVPIKNFHGGVHSTFLLCQIMEDVHVKESNQCLIAESAMGQQARRHSASH